MTVDASGILSKPLEHTRLLLANCEAFQTWVGVAAGDLGTPTGVTEATEHIYLVAVNEAKDDSKAVRAARRPLAFVDFDDGADGTKDSEPVGWLHSGSAIVAFEAVSDAETTDADAVMTLTNNVGAILEEIEANEFQNVNNWILQSAPARVDTADEGQGKLDRVQLVIQLMWGVSAE